MANIELVIRIPEGLKDAFNHEEQWTALLCAEMRDVLQNGKQLPKGHDRLVDISPLMRGLYEEKCVGELTYTTSEVYELVNNNTDTIIEADTESEE